MLLLVSSTKSGGGVGRQSDRTCKRKVQSEDLLSFLSFFLSSSSSSSSEICFPTFSTSNYKSKTAREKEGEVGP